MSHSEPTDDTKVWIVCSVVADPTDSSVTWVGTGSGGESGRPLVIRLTDSWARDLAAETEHYMQVVGSLYENYTLHMEGLRSEHPSGKKEG